MLSEEQAIDILQNQIADYVIGNYCTKCGDFIICENKDEDCYHIQAIDTVLTLITKLQKENEEKDKQIELMADTLQDNLYFSPLDGLNREEIKLYFEKLAKEKGE